MSGSEQWKEWRPLLLSAKILILCYQWYLVSVVIFDLRAYCKNVMKDLDICYTLLTLLNYKNSRSVHPQGQL